MDAAVARAPFIDAQAPQRAGGRERGMRPRRAMTAPGSLPLREARPVRTTAECPPSPPHRVRTTWNMALSAATRAFRPAVRYKN